MNIEASHREKQIMMFAVAVLRKKLGQRASVENIHNELISSNNKAISELVKQMYKTVGYMKTTHQPQIITEYGELAIWIAYHSKTFEPLLEKCCNALTKYTYDNTTKQTYTLSYVEEKLIKIGLHYINKELHKFFTFDEIKKEINTEINPAIIYLQNELRDIIGIENKELIEIMELMLWFATHDTAYRDAFFWNINKIGNKQLRELSLPYVIEPSLWYGNLWVDSKELTVKQRASGEIPSYALSMPESLCRPNRGQTKKRK